MLILASTIVPYHAATLIAMQQAKLSAIFSANLQKVLTHQSLSVNGAAVSWRVPQKTLESFVKGTRTPSIDTAHIVAQAAGYHLWQMVNEHFDPGNPPMLQPVTPAEKAFHEDLAKLIQKHRETVK